MTSSVLRRLSGGLAVTVLALSAAACGGATATSAPATVAPSIASQEPSAAASQSAASAAPSSGASLATTGRIAFPDKGFAVTLPTGWTRIDLSADDLDALIAAAGQTNPQLTEAYSAQIKAMVANGLVLFAFGPDPSKGTNVNILVAPSLGVSMDLLEQANVAQIKSMAQGEVASERVTLPAGQAIHLQYKLAAQGQPTAASLDQYFLLTDKTQIVVSVTNGQAGEGKAIADSVEILD